MRGVWGGGRAGWMRWRAWGGCVALGSDGVVAGVGWEEGGVLREIP